MIWDKSLVIICGLDYRCNWTMTLLRPEKEEILWHQVSKDGKVLPPRRSYRRRFSLIAIAAISVLVIVLFSSYLRSTSPSLGTGLPGSGSSKNPTAPTFVYPISTGAAVPYSKLPGLSVLKYSGATGVSPQWAPVPDTSGQITNGGDIGVVDATSVTKPLLVNVTITNLTNLEKSYSSFAFPIDIYEWCPANTTTPGIGTPCGTQANTGNSTTGDTAGSWVPYENGTSYGMVPNQQLFITNTTGTVSLTLPKGFYYDFTMDPHQGSFYCISTSNPSDLSPSFYISAKES